MQCFGAVNGRTVSPKILGLNTRIFGLFLGSPIHCVLIFFFFLLLLKIE